MVNHIVFVKIIINMMICHHYGESYCFCYYYYGKSSPPNFDSTGKNEIHQYD